jgi:ubiquinone/menaquinone biosynthesis C-methylase UbiE
MKNYILLTLLFIANYNLAFAQKNERPFRCGFYSRDTTQFNKFYNTTLQYIEIKKGEKVASVGAQNGNVEIQLSLFIDSIEFTLQDIDSSCLNEIEIQKVKNYYEALVGKTITNKFNIVVGAETKTNLENNYYHRVLLLNVYHELSEKKLMLDGIYACLKNKGRLVVMERMGKKKGKKRHDCNHIMPFEPDFLAEMKTSNFVLVSKTANVNKSLTFYVFEKS